MDFQTYLTELAANDPTPGGGSAATLVGAMAAALVAMVARICAQNPAYADRYDETAAIIDRADVVRVALAQAREADENAYGAVVRAMALPKRTVDEKTERTQRLQRALAGAAAAPLRAAGLALEALELAKRASALHNVHLQSDVECAIVFARASIAASALNVRVNHAYLKDADLIATQEAALNAIEAAAAPEVSLPARGSPSSDAT